MTLVEGRVKYRTKNYIRWNTEEYVEKQEGIFNIVDMGKNTIILIPGGEDWRERISISKKAFEVVRLVK